MSETVTVTLEIGSEATGGIAAANDYYAAHGQDGEWRLEKAYFCPQITTALDGSDYVSMELFQGYSGSSTAIATAMTTQTVAFTVGTVREFTLSENSSREFGPTDTLFCDLNEAGTFTAGMRGAIVCRFRKIRA